MRLICAGARHESYLTPLLPKERATLLLLAAEIFGLSALFAADLK
jgi:hypothetical protein